MLEITDNAAHRIHKQRTSNKNPKLYLRICVESGGCSGFKYVFSFEDAALQEDDVSLLHNEALVVIDNLSLSLVTGSKLDYVETLGQAGFEMINPAATARCGCGNSFSM